jgi:hypothetical protein
MLPWFDERFDDSYFEVSLVSDEPDCGWTDYEHLLVPQLSEVIPKTFLDQYVFQPSL